MFDSNETIWDVFFHCSVELDYKSRRIVLFFVYLIAFMVGLAANSVVVWVNWQRRHSRSTDVFCTLNICISHLMVMTIMPVFLLEVMMDYVWMWGQFLCRFTTFIYEFNYYSTSFFLAYMSVERYLALTRASVAIATPPRPWGPAEKRRRVLICAGFWTFALLLTPLLVSNVQLVEYHSPGCYLAPEKDYVTWVVVITMTSMIFQFLIPGAIIITCNWLTVQALKKSPELQASYNVDTKMFHFYSAAFVVCWLPYHLVNLLIMVDDLNPLILNCNTTNLVYFSLNVLFSFTHLHYIANPVLYNFLSPSFRRSLLRAVARYVRKEAIAIPVEDGVEAEGKNKPKNTSLRKMSNASTSQSDMDS
ncbi:G-protein coupled receptor 182-like [Alosa pseudoharengus]|uniref:G-protein coupled receptor 182-like n=1 Tax=Alosa pseudoharengus TaxID=34774 RepID=UPI003F8ACDA9